MMCSRERDATVPYLLSSVDLIRKTLYEITELVLGMIQEFSLGLRADRRLLKALV
jgi:hypothetical protein